MADTERPKRLRGAKLLEEGYRAGFKTGFNAGYEAGVREQQRQRDYEQRYEAAITEGIAELRNAADAKPKRVRRARPHPMQNVPGPGPVNPHVG